MAFGSTPSCSQDGVSKMQSEANGTWQHPFLLAIMASQGCTERMQSYCEAVSLVVQLLDEEDSADEDFWNQDFFQEEKADDDYKSESSEASTADEDFSELVNFLPCQIHSCKQHMLGATTHACTAAKY